MRIVLIKSVPKLGCAGEVVNVRSGYARNWLIPSGNAVIATSQYLSQLDSNMQIIKDEDSLLRNEAQSNFEKLNERTFSFAVEASDDDGKLFGSVRVKDIAFAVSEFLEKRILPSNVVISNTIKYVGSYTASITLHDDIVCRVNISVEKRQS